MEREVVVQGGQSPFCSEDYAKWGQSPGAQKGDSPREPNEASASFFEIGRPMNGAQGTAFEDCHA